MTSMGDPPTQIYHLALRGEWEKALAVGDYRRSTIDRSLEEEGFIHCSFVEQVQATADRFYRGRRDVVLLGVDPSRIDAEVRVENLHGGEDLFPHIYGPLPVDAVVTVEAVPVDVDGRLIVPEAAG